MEIPEVRRNLALESQGSKIRLYLKQNKQNYQNSFNVWIYSTLFIYQLIDKFNLT